MTWSRSECRRAEPPTSRTCARTDDSGSWFRSCGNENWEFEARGFMRRRIASIDDLPIRGDERRYHWPLGRRPDARPGLSELGL